MTLARSGWAEEELGSQAPLLSGIGDHQRKITTASSHAQRYFSQGLSLFFGYHYVESVASFREATAADSECAMAWWGLALAIAPNPNSRYFNAPDDPRGLGRKAIQRAFELRDGASPLDRALIDALQARYDSERRPEPGDRDLAYTEALQAIHEEYPDDADVATLYAESRMMLSPWQYWNPDGSPRVGAAEAKTALEQAIRLDPRHPGAHHFFIHLMEDYSDPTVALPSALVLEGLMPNVGHIVHMPSHIYIQMGRYEQVLQGNLEALEANKRLLEEWGERGFPDDVPSMGMRASPEGVHARRFLHLAALRLGKHDQAIESLTAALGGAEPDVESLGGDTRKQIIWSQLWFTYRSFGDWDEIFEIPEVPAGAPIATGNRLAARGCAWLARGDIDMATQELLSLQRLLAGLGPTAQGLLGIPMHELAGLVAEAQGDIERALGHLETAVRLEDSLPYYEPPLWQHPVRLTLGHVLLRAGRPWESQVVFWEDLRRNPENGRALFGLWKSLDALGEQERAERVGNRFREAWGGDDEPVPLGLLR